MKIADWKKKTFKIALVISLLVVLLATAACQDMGFPSTTQSEETPEPEPADTSRSVIGTRDAAILAVYQRLLSKAESYEAKIYLSDFYASCDNWTAQSEYYRDGSGTWYVVVDMTAEEDWELHPYWQQASWFVFKDGEVIPSNLFQANALRIEADLQELSPESQPEPE